MAVSIAKPFYQSLAFALWLILRVETIESVWFAGQLPHPNAKSREDRSRTWAQEERPRPTSASVIIGGVATCGPHGVRQRKKDRY